jgi:hypothetical protein
MNDMDDLWDKSARAAASLQRIADQMAQRAINRDVYGVGNSELDLQIAANHYNAYRRVLELGDQLEQAAIEAGILRKPSEET